MHKLVLLQRISVCRRPVENKYCEFVTNTEDSWSGIHKFTRDYHVKIRFSKECFEVDIRSEQNEHSHRNTLQIRNSKETEPV
jgi:hypothetical protein